jgi:DNA-binding transcriptional LysR family regulator
MSFNAEALNAFIATARCGSFAGAAQRLNKVPNAIAYNVHKLEDALGVALFERQAKHLVLTEAGAYLLRRSEIVMDELADMHDATVRVGKGYEAELRLSVNNIVSLRPLLPLLAESEAAFPQTEIRLAIDVHNGVWDALVDKRADIAVGAPNEVTANADVVAHAQGEIEWVFAISPRHPLATAREPIPTELLARHAAICIADTSVRLEPKVAWRLQGQKALVAPDYQHKIRMHVAGLGVGFLPTHFAAPHLAVGELVAREVETPKPPTPLFIAWRRSGGGRCRQWWLDRLADPTLRAAMIASPQ